MILEQALFFIALLAPWAILVANTKLFLGKHKVIFAIASIAFVYVSLLFQVNLIDSRLENELYAFDLNGDSVFSGLEINPAQEEAMENLVNDTGRAMAPITGAIFSVAYTVISFMVYFFASWAWSKYRAKNI
ncbi:hypothetical protein [Simplicispira lacusdiani]|uniref:hypothetical protein n=1 Tax=Simplicispira lacusdiani TaxID=2213010 RepID=UPI0013002292|nr:hypothetical protein [Simplicispira lacusdiani]